jgi:protease-4
MYESQGIKAEPITSGKYKAAGFPGTSLTEAQREDLQGYVDRLAAQFQAHVTASRGEISPELMQGQTFQSDVALEHGLVDGIYRSLDEMIAAVV